MKNKILVLLFFVSLLLFSCKKEEVKSEIIIESSAIDKVDASGCLATANIVSVGDRGVSDHGWCWSKDENPTIANSKLRLGALNQAKTIRENIYGLEPETKFYIRPFASGASDIVYGEQTEFTTDILDFEVLSPIVNAKYLKNQTYEIFWTSNIKDPLNIELIKGETSFILVENIQNSGSYNWVVADSYSQGTDYKIKISSAINAHLYAESEEFTIYEETIPIVETTEISEVGMETATIKGSVLDDGGIEITAQGMCYGLEPTPDLNDFFTTNSAGIGDFTCELSNLEKNTTYYVRAYATNSLGTAFGNELSFITDAQTYYIPTIVINSISNLSFTSVDVLSEVVDNGGIDISALGICYSLSPEPTLDDNTIAHSSSEQKFTANIVDLAEKTTYYVRAYATNQEGTAYSNQISLTTLENITGQTASITDIEGNVYNTIGIGAQMWMAENLRVTHYPDGAEIPHITENTKWVQLGNNNTDDAYCWYNNDIVNKETNGALYTWAAAMGDNGVSSSTNPSQVQGVCPDGWHLPSDAEWTELTSFMISRGFGYQGSGSDIAKSMAAINAWASSTQAGTVGNEQETNNSSEFNALPSGYRRNSDGNFYDSGNYTYWWTSTKHDSYEVVFWGILYYYSTVFTENTETNFGLSVRCVRD